MNGKQIVSLIGSAILLIGCCMPIANHLQDATVGYMFSQGVVPGGIILVALGVLGIYGASVSYTHLTLPTIYSV